MRSIDEIIKGMEACRTGDCRNCPYMAGGEACGDMLALDTIEVLKQMQREHPDGLMTMETEEA